MSLSRRQQENKDLQRAVKDGVALMKQLEPTKFPEHQLHWRSVVRGLYEQSSQTEFATARINVIG
jgi:hypothetical protein